MFDKSSLNQNSDDSRCGDKMNKLSAFFPPFGTQAKLTGWPRLAHPTEVKTRGSPRRYGDKMYAFSFHSQAICVYTPPIYRLQEVT
jgi:hypothetical protein